LVLSAVGLLLSACGAHHAVTAGATQQPAAQPIVHVVTASPAGILVNAYLVESEHGVVCVDSALTVSDTNALTAKLNVIGKPLLAVLLTHGHPDHYNGVAGLVAGRGDIPIYATLQVNEVIRSYDAAKEQQWTPMFGAEWPKPRAFPNRAVADGASLDIDGLTWRVRSVGPGESHADSIWMMSADKPLVFLGDVVLHGMHAYTTDGHTAAWLKNLDRLRSDLAGAKTLYPGHGSAGGLELLDWQADYLNKYRAEVNKLRQGRPQLTDVDKQALTTRMKELFPDNQLEFLIALGADAVADELVAESAQNHGASK
jgi:glyoxylase-like metal-dependent hydrolase (beta-lactamase superfamily II)